MILSYRALSKSINVELDIDNIEAHLHSLVRTMNVDVNGNLIYNETINPDLITLVGEDETEQEVIDRVYNQAPYLKDPSSELYLGQQLDRLLFFENGAGHKEKFISYVPGVASNVVPYKLLDTDSIIIKFIQFENTYLCSGNIIDFVDVDNSTILYSLDVGTTQTTSYFQDNIDVVINGPINIGCYINNNRLDNPAIVVGTRKVWELG